MKWIAVLLFLLSAACAAQTYHPVGPAPFGPRLDPYPTFVQWFASEYDAHCNCSDWSYAGQAVDANGWTDYMIQTPGCYGACTLYFVIVHVPVPGAPADVAFIGDSTVELMQWWSIHPNLATINLGIGGDTCEDEVPRMGEILTMPIRAIVLACGNSDVWYYTTFGPTKSAILSITADAKAAGVPFVLATLTPVLSVTPSETQNPATVAQYIFDLNAWIRVQGLPMWDRWNNIASGHGLYGIPDCYWSDGVHPGLCQQQLSAGLELVLNGQ